MSTATTASRRLRLGPRSAGLERDYVFKRTEYREIEVREYWVVDRFRRTLTAFSFAGASDRSE